MRSIRKVIASNEDKATECLKDIKRLESELDFRITRCGAALLNQEDENPDLVIKLKILRVCIPPELRTFQITQLLSTLGFLAIQWHRETRRLTQN